MSHRYALAFILVLAGTPAVQASPNHPLYGAVPLETHPELHAAFGRALEHCRFEASDPVRGSDDVHSLLFDVALRACLYRRGFFEGRYAYPVRITYGS